MYQIITVKSFNLATDNLKILLVRHLRKIVPRLDMCELELEFASLVTNSMTLS
jgi:hypothetical protein